MTQHTDSIPQNSAAGKRLVGSTASTRQFYFFCANSAISAFGQGALPAPGEPVIPIITDLPGVRESFLILDFVVGILSSISLISLDAARTSPCKFFLHFP